MVSKVSRLAEILEVSADYLTGKTNEPNSNKNKLQVRDEHDNIIVLDDETRDIIDELRSWPDMKMLFPVSKGAPEDLITAVKIIEALKSKGGSDR